MHAERIDGDQELAHGSNAHEIIVVDYANRSVGQIDIDHPVTGL